jgi:hypothetical protein
MTSSCTHRSYPPERFVSEFETDDAVITGSDGPTTRKGRTQNIALIRDYMKAYTAIKARAVYTQLLSPTVAYSFVVFRATRSDPVKPTVTSAKSLYVWAKTPAGWRTHDPSAADHRRLAISRLHFNT